MVSLGGNNDSVFDLLIFNMEKIASICHLTLAEFGFPGVPSKASQMRFRSRISC